jgi:hypothetical protein
MDTREILERTILSEEVNMAWLESENGLNDVGELARTSRALAQERQEARGQRYDAYHHWGLNE